MMSRPELLATISLFSAMDDEERRAIAALMDEMTFSSEEAIYRASDQGDACYIITAGSVRLCIVDDTGTEVALDVLRPGDEFGELSLLDGGDRSMNAITMEPTTALVLKRDDFIELLRSRPDAALDVMQVLAKRIRRVDDLLRRRVSRDPNATIAERDSFGHRVADGVARFGGSWHFIGLFFLFLIVWISSNTFLIFYNRAGRPVDPYPFILLNLFLSMLASIQAPVILMSQNRQDAKDRIRSELDYQVNLKAELEIADLHHKMDVLTSHMLDNPPRTDTMPIRGNDPRAALPPE